MVSGICKRGEGCWSHGNNGTAEKEMGLSRGTVSPARACAHRHGPASFSLAIPPKIPVTSQNSATNFVPLVCGDPTTSKT